MFERVREWAENGSVGGYVVIMLTIAFFAFFWIMFGSAFDIFNDVTNQQVNAGMATSGERIETQNLILSAHKAAPVFVFILILVWGILIALRERTEVS